MIFGGEKCLWLRSGVDSDENDHMTLMLLVVFVSVVNVAAAAAPSENGNHTFWQYQVTLRTRRDELASTVKSMKHDLGYGTHNRTVSSPL